MLRHRESGKPEVRDRSRVCPPSSNQISSMIQERYKGNDDAQDDEPADHALVPVELKRHIDAEEGRGDQPHRHQHDEPLQQHR